MSDLSSDSSYTARPKMQERIHLKEVMVSVGVQTTMKTNNDKEIERLKEENMQLREEILKYKNHFDQQKVH